MLDVLVRDGRAPYSALAAATGVSEARAARRLRALLQQLDSPLGEWLDRAALGEIADQADQEAIRLS